MIIYKGGNRVGKGTYWDFSSGRRIDVPGDAILSGGGGATYLRLRPSVVLLSGPVIGLVYAAVMPLLGIATAATLAVGRIVGGAYNLAAKTVSFGWTPRNAYLSGKKKKSGKKE